MSEGLIICHAYFPGKTITARAFANPVETPAKPAEAALPVKKIIHAALPTERLRFHLRSCHRGTEIENNTLKVVNGGPSPSRYEKLDPCHSCTNAKSHHKPVPHTRVNRRTRDPARRLVYTDWYGPLARPGNHGETYVQAFLDDASGAVCAFACRSKADGAANLRAYCAMIAELTDGKAKVATIQGDFEKLFTHGGFAAECTRLGIIQRFSAPYSHEQNGRIERWWRTMENGVAAMHDYSGAPQYLWPYALQTFVAHYNRMSNSQGTLTPFEQLTGTRPNISFFRVWGCPAQAHLEKRDHAKFTSKCIDVINLGPAMNTKDAFHIYIPSRRTVRVTRHIAFDELWRARAEHYQMLGARFPSITNGFKRPDPPSPPESENPAPPPATISSKEDTDEPLTVLHGAPPSPPSPPRPIPQLASRPRGPPNRASATAPRRHQPPRTAHAQRALNFQEPPPAVTATNLIPPSPPLAPNGPNINTNNSRFIPITVHNDRLEISHIVRTDLDSKTGEKLYVGNYPASYNMTPDAYRERTCNITGGRNFQHATKVPSVYDPTKANFDVTWKQFGESRDNFPPAMADSYDAAPPDSRTARAAARAQTQAAPAPDPEPPSPPPTANYCTCRHSDVPPLLTPSVPFVHVISGKPAQIPPLITLPPSPVLNLPTAGPTPRPLLFPAFVTKLNKKFYCKQKLVLQNLTEKPCITDSKP